MNVDGTKLLLLSWVQDAQKGLIRESCFEQLSNRWDGSSNYANPDTKATAPKDIIQRIKSDFDSEKLKVTQYMLKPFGGTFRGGEQFAKGFENSTEAWVMECYYNCWRYPYKFANGKGPSSKTQGWMIKAKNGIQFAMEYVGKTRDYFTHTAIIDGAMPLLTDNQYWADNEIASLKTAPVNKRLHPKLFYKGQTAAISRSADYDTDVTNVIAAVKAMTSSSKFDLASANSVVNIARSHCRPLKGHSIGGQAYTAVAMISEIQSMDLMTDSAWQSAVLNGDNRGENNRMLTGVLGVYKGVLFLVNMRSPVFGLAADSGTGLSLGVNYLKPGTEVASTTDSGYINGTEQVPRLVKGASGTATGSCEICMILGAGSVVSPLATDGANEITIESEKDDFSFRESFCTVAYEGGQRADFITPDGSVKNFSSAIYLTATPTLVL